jgi:hypothetical protein
MERASVMSALPLKRTSSASASMSAKCQEQTCTLATNAPEGARRTRMLEKQPDNYQPKSTDPRMATELD